MKSFGVKTNVTMASFPSPSTLGLGWTIAGHGDHEAEIVKKLRGCRRGFVDATIETGDTPSFDGGGNGFGCGRRLRDSA